MSSDPPEPPTPPSSQRMASAIALALVHHAEHLPRAEAAAILRQAAEFDVSDETDDDVHRREIAGA